MTRRSKRELTRDLDALESVHGDPGTAAEWVEGYIHSALANGGDLVFGDTVVDGDGEILKPPTTPIRCGSWNGEVRLSPASRVCGCLRPTSRTGSTSTPISR